MKSILLELVAIVCLASAGSVSALDMQGTPAVSNLFQCGACHAVEHKLVGPSWMDISRFYNGKVEKTPTGKTLKEATGGMTPEDWLVKKVSVGGAGNWGNQPMLANDNTFNQQNPAKQAEIKTLIQFVLSLSKE